jgi:hypothetical protein
VLGGTSNTIVSFGLWTELVCSTQHIKASYDLEVGIVLEPHQCDNLATLTILQFYES